MQYINHAGETMRRPFVAIIICTLLLTVGCTEDNKENPVTPNVANVANFDTTQFALIPAGTFCMGNITSHPAGKDNEKPIHDVTITRPFLISRTEVTQAQYEAVMGYNPSHFTGADHPVEMVCWYDAVAFCNALSLQDGLDTCYSGSGASTACDFTADGYRLPTEAEWEYACRGGTDTDFYTGNMTHGGNTPLDSALNLAGWYCGNSGDSTHAVALKVPNSFGLYDMHGNVFEWCWDRCDYNYYGNCPGNDPRGPVSGSLRILRGGTWYYNAWVCRSAYRGKYNPSLRHNGVGFRIVRTYLDEH